MKYFIVHRGGHTPSKRTVETDWDSCRLIGGLRENIRSAYYKFLRSCIWLKSNSFPNQVPHDIMHGVKIQEADGRPKLTLAGVVGGQLLLKLPKQLLWGGPPNALAPVCLVLAWTAPQSWRLCHLSHWCCPWRLPHKAQLTPQTHCLPPTLDMYPETPVHIHISCPSIQRAAMTHHHAFLLWKVPEGSKILSSRHVHHAFMPCVMSADLLHQIEDVIFR